MFQASYNIQFNLNFLKSIILSQKFKSRSSLSTCTCKYTKNTFEGSTL